MLKNYKKCPNSRLWRAHSEAWDLMSQGPTVSRKKSLQTCNSECRLYNTKAVSLSQLKYTSYKCVTTIIGWLTECFISDDVQIFHIKNPNLNKLLIGQVTGAQKTVVLNHSILVLPRTEHKTSLQIALFGYDLNSISKVTLIFLISTINTNKVVNNILKVYSSLIIQNVSSHLCSYCEGWKPFC